MEPSLAKEGRGDSKSSALRAVTSPLPEEEGLGEKVEPSLRVKRDGVIFEKIPPSASG